MHKYVVEERTFLILFVTRKNVKKHMEKLEIMERPKISSPEKYSERMTFHTLNMEDMFNIF